VGLRAAILANPETVSDLAVAAPARFGDGEALLAQGRFHGSVYMLGLAAEMWLKYAAFRCRGAALSDDVQSQLGLARSFMRKHRPLINAESFHSLAFWCEYLLALRHARGLPLAADDAGRLRHHVARLFDGWKIDMRYSSLPADERDGKRCFRDVAWVKSSVASLWR